MIYRHHTWSWCLWRDGDWLQVVKTAAVLTLGLGGLKWSGWRDILRKEVLFTDCRGEGVEEDMVLGLLFALPRILPEHWTTTKANKLKFPQRVPTKSPYLGKQSSLSSLFLIRLRSLHVSTSCDMWCIDCDTSSLSDPDLSLSNSN